MNKKHAKEIIADDPDKVAWMRGHDKGSGSSGTGRDALQTTGRKKQESVSSLQNWLSDKHHSIKSLSSGINTEGKDRKDENEISRNP